MILIYAFDLSLLTNNNIIFDLETQFSVGKLFVALSRRYAKILQLYSFAMIQFYINFTVF